MRKKKASDDFECWLSLKLGYSDPSHVRALPLPVYQRWLNYYLRNNQHPLSVVMTAGIGNCIAARVAGSKDAEPYALVWPPLEPPKIKVADTEAVAALFEGMASG